MSYRNAQMVMVTKQRRRTGGAGILINVILTFLTGGLWLVVPVMQWALHAVGPRKKVRTAVYGQPQQYGYAYPQYPAPVYGQPPQQPGWQWNPQAQQWQWCG